MRTKPEAETHRERNLDNECCRFSDSFQIFTLNLIIGYYHGSSVLLLGGMPLNLIIFWFFPFFCKGLHVFFGFQV